LVADDTPAATATVPPTTAKVAAALSITEILRFIERSPFLDRSDRRAVCARRSLYLLQGTEVSGVVEIRPDHIWETLS
jgi:hypothetical protein